MGFDPISLSLMAAQAIGSAAAGAGSAITAAATGAGAAGTAATGVGAAAADAASISAGIGAESGALLSAAPVAAAAHAGLSASTLLTLGAAGGGVLSSVLAPKPPSLGAPPKAPTPFQGSGASALIGPSTGTAGGTFVTGNNRAPQIAGGKKTLLGQ